MRKRGEGGREGKGRRERASSWGLCERGQAALMLIYMMLGLCLLRPMSRGGLFRCAVESSCGTRGRAPGKFGTPLAACSQHAAWEWRECLDTGWGWGGGDPGTPGAPALCCVPLCFCIPLCISLSDSLSSPVPQSSSFCLSKWRRRKELPVQGSIGRASWGGRGPSMGPHPLLPPYRVPICGSDQAPSQTKAILSQIHKPTSPTLQD